MWKFLEVSRRVFLQMVETARAVDARTFARVVCLNSIAPNEATIILLVLLRRTHISGRLN